MNPTRQSIFVISDLHLGGSPPSQKSPFGFQMTSPEGRSLLVAFIKWVQQQSTPDNGVHLVLAGDIVDFLAEQDFSPFTQDENQATRKLEAILDPARKDGTSEIFDALASFVKPGQELTLLLGNHDPELSLPAPRRLLMSRLGSNARRVEFLYDNQALIVGPVLIEHGNRYDSWNVWSHDSLRQLRSALSRREQLPVPFEAPPGSQLVHQVMNSAKQKYAFVDLLKPEREAVIPLLIALLPKSYETCKQIAQAASLTVHAGMERYSSTGQPLAPSKVGRRLEEQSPLALAEELLEASGPAKVSDGPGESVVDRLLTWKEHPTYQGENPEDRSVLVHLLCRAVRAFRGAHNEAFDTTKESGEYLRSANTAAHSGFKVIVYGHTHLAKAVELEKGAMYYNSGTWADLMRFPKSVFEADMGQAERDFRVFFSDIKANQLSRWRRPLPTFVRIDMKSDLSDDNPSADVFVFGGPSEKKIQPLPRGQLGYHLVD